MLVGGWDNSPPGRIDPLNLGFLGINFNNMVLGRLLRLSLVRILVVEKKSNFLIYRWCRVRCLDNVDNKSLENLEYRLKHKVTLEYAI